MQCKFCRTDIPEGANICPVCGTPVPKEENAATQQSDTENQATQQNDTGNQEQQQFQYQYGTNEPNMNGQYSYGQPNQPNYGQPNGQYNYGQPNQPNYGQPNGQYNYGQPNYSQGDKPVNGTPYMIFSILATLFCCLPLGIAGIVFASRINALQRMGDYEGAKAAAKKAKIFTILSAVLGLVVIIIYGVYAGLAIKDNMNVTTDIGNTTIEAPVQKEEKVSEPVEPTTDIGSAWTSYTVEINGSAVTFPCDLADMEAAGLKLDTEETPEDYMVNVGEYEFSFLETTEGNYLMADMVNLTDSAQKIVDCKVGGIYVDSWETEDGNLTVIFPGGVQIGTTKEELIAAYGEPADTYEGESINSYSWYDGDSYFKSLDVDVDVETGLVTGLSIQAYEF